MPLRARSDQVETSETLCFHNGTQTVRLRFHGKEEVLSSNLTRSTKNLKHLQKQERRTVFLQSKWSPKMDRQRRGGLSVRRRASARDVPKCGYTLGVPTLRSHVFKQSSWIFDVNIYSKVSETSIQPLLELTNVRAPVKLPAARPAGTPPNG